jgi:hypothetical protein
MCNLQTARPVLYDAQTVNSMIADIDRIDLPCIESQPLSKETTSDMELNAECNILNIHAILEHY